MRTAVSNLVAAHSRRHCDKALLLRGYSDFDDRTAYEAFVQTIVQRLNARADKRLALERALARSAINPIVKAGPPANSLSGYLKQEMAEREVRRLERHRMASC